MSKSRTCKHGLSICARCVIVTDAGKRISDAIRLAVTFRSWEELQHGWMAFALADGATDHIIYPSKNEAARRQSNEYLYLYVCMRSCMSGMPPKDAQLFLEVHREAYSAGMRLAEPEAPSIIMPVARGVGAWPQ